MLVRRQNLEFSFIADVNENDTDTLEDNLTDSYKIINMDLLYGPEIHSDIFIFKNEGLCSHKNLHMDIYSSFIHKIAKTWNQSRCPSTGKRINKLWYIHIKEYYSAVERNTTSQLR